MSARPTTSPITRREFVHRATIAAVSLPLAGITGIVAANAVSAVLPTLSPTHAEALTTTSTTVVTTTTTTTLANTYIVSVVTGYLALRCEMAYDERNELSALYTGDIVQVIQRATDNDNYWLVYAPRLGIHGYVNCNYLVAAL